LRAAFFEEGFAFCFALLASGFGRLDLLFLDAAFFGWFRKMTRSRMPSSASLAIFDRHGAPFFNGPTSLPE
jgi:hypothetical protein